MNRSRPVLVTGHRGYLGSVMAPYLVEQGYDVIGLDTGFFDECTLVDDPPAASRIRTIRKDIRDLHPDDVRDVYAVVHLAALSNDPIGNLDPGWTKAINHDASVRLAELARDAGVRRFLYSSSCIMYGDATTETVDERAPLDPKTDYARSKVSGEQAVSALATDDFSPVFLRNGTVYGPSPRMRFDTVLNDMVAAAYVHRKVQVLSDGTPWRPVIHVEDVARSFARVLEAPTADIHDQAFNNGADHLNHQVIELAEIAAAVVPGCDLEVLSEPTADQRTYKADFGKFRRTFPDFEWRWGAKEGAMELAEAFDRIGLTHEQYEGQRFVRLRWLNHLRATGQIDDDLRWRVAP